MPAIVLNGPLVHQEPAVGATKRYKALRWGRRRGKTETAQFCAVMGHGQGWQTSTPKAPPQFPGCIHGWHVIWIAPDFSQNDNLWLEIEATFRPDPRIKVNKQARTIDFPGGGRLWCRSAENADAIRGAGKRLIGIVIEEAAHLDLQAVLGGEALVTLMDNYGAGSWLIVISTTNSGQDGNSAHRVPSYFNILCDECMKGERPEWYHEHGDALTNPLIDPQAFQALLGEYKVGMEHDRDEQLFALLLQGGVSQPYIDIWNPAVHVRDYPTQLPDGGRVVAGMDWGYDHPGAFQLFYVWHNGYKLRKHLRWEFPFGRTTPNGAMTAHAVGKAIGAGVQRFVSPEFVVYDRAMNASTREGKAVNSVKTDVLAGWTEAVGGNAWKVPAFTENVGTEESRRQRKLLMVNVLTWEGEASTLKPWQEPELTVDRSCSAFIGTVPYLTSDPLDPTKIDKKQDRENDFDCTTYVCEQLPSDFCESTAVKGVPEDQHPGYDKHGKRKSRDWSDEVEEEWGGVEIEQGGYYQPEGRGGRVDGFEH